VKKVIKKVAGFFIMLVLVVSLIPGITGCTETEQETGDTQKEGTITDTGTALTITKGETTVKYTLAEVKAMPSQEGWGGIMNSSGVISGPFKQKGVSLMYLLNKVGGISEGDAIRITAKDGYSMTYSYDQIANGNFTTLDCSTGNEVPHGTLNVIITYEEDGVELTDQIGPLRVAILNDDTQVTEGHWWIKWVELIEVISSEQPWELKLEGYIEELIDSATFESGAAPGCHGATWTDDQNRVWEGIPLWLLVGRVDDENYHSKESKAFNDTIADAGYEVEIIAADGFSITMTSKEIRRNDDLIISYRRDGMPLPDNQWPLRLVGPGLEKSKMVGQITTIKVTLSQAALDILENYEPAWTLSLEGAISLTLSDMDFSQGAKCHPASWTDADGRVWEGIALWLLVGRVDDEISHDENSESTAFNDELADAGYEVTITAADGYSKTFTSAQIKRNDNMIIAYLRDGGELPENQWPLRLVGPDLTKGEMVGQVVSITIIFP
jgi:DMSO/TMAO reductase YedYZ molybdopterin-dependent catalytic subunit